MRVVMSRFGCPQSRLAGIVETLDDLEKLAEVRNIGPCGRVEIELALLDELQSRRTGDRLGGRKDRKELSVVISASSLPRAAFSGCALVDVAVAGRSPSRPRREHADPSVTTPFRMASAAALKLRYSSCFLPDVNASCLKPIIVTIG